MRNILVTAAHAAIDSSADIVNGTSPAVPEVVGWGSYVQSIGILLLLLGGLYGLLWFVRKVGMNKGFRGNKGSKRTLDVEERFHLAPKKQLVVVRFLNKRLLLGVTDHQINLYLKRKRKMTLATPLTRKNLKNLWDSSATRILTLSALLLLVPAVAFAARDLAVPSLSLALGAGQSEPENVSVLLEILFLLTILSLAPAIMLTVTSFTRIIIVFSFLRQALGTQQLPPSQVLASLAIFMTFVIMRPVGMAINDNALQPYLSEQIGFTVALDEAQKPLREFMFKHTREKDLSLFYSISKMERPKSKTEVPTMMLAAAYVISELKTGFTIGFLIYVPFLIIDMVVSSILLAMGMMMLPPMMVSMPFKLLLFVLVDGWSLLTGSLVNSFLL